MDPMPRSDEELVASARSGDRTAMNELLHRHHDTVYRVRDCPVHFREPSRTKRETSRPAFHLDPADRQCLRISVDRHNLNFLTH